MKPVFQYTKITMPGKKKEEIMRVAQENLYMFKRINERTSVYNVDKWNRDYSLSQYYKKIFANINPLILVKLKEEVHVSMCLLQCKKKE